MATEAFFSFVSDEDPARAKLEVWSDLYLKNILIVDDSPLIRRTLRGALAWRSEWSVCGEAADGREALVRALDLHPDLVLLDLCMPVMDGLQTARELRKFMPKISILMFTIFCDEVIARAALDSGVQAVRSKSDSMASLHQCIHQLLQTA